MPHGCHFGALNNFEIFGETFVAATLAKEVET